MEEVHTHISRSIATDQSPKCRVGQKLRLAEQQRGHVLKKITAEIFLNTIGLWPCQLRQDGFIYTSYEVQLEVVCGFGCPDRLLADYVFVKFKVNSRY